MVENIYRSLTILLALALAVDSQAIPDGLVLTTGPQLSRDFGETLRSTQPGQKWSKISTDP